MKASSICKMSDKYLRGTDQRCYVSIICISSQLELFGDVYKRVNWDARTAGVYFHDKTGSCRMDFKNEEKLREKKRKF